MCRCPVCRSERSSRRFNLTAPEAAQQFVLRESSPERNDELSSHINKLWGGQDCEIRQCDECGFGFADPYVSGDAKFYSLAYERASYPREKWEFDRTVSELSSIGFHGERVLEVGAGFGNFLDKIVGTHVSRSGITAIEYSQKALTILQRKGYMAIEEDLRVADIAYPFDAIFLFQVLEHMAELDSLFARISQLLKEGGLLFIAVPNGKRITFNEQNGSLLDTPPNHIGRWSPAAFKILADRHNLSLDKLEVEPFSLFEFIKQDVVYSYLRSSHIAGTAANWTRTLRSHWYGKLVGVACAALLAPRRINVWRKAAKTGDLGGSAWGVFTKVKVE